MLHRICFIEYKFFFTSIFFCPFIILTKSFVSFISLSIEMVIICYHISFLLHYNYLHLFLNLLQTSCFSFYLLFICAEKWSAAHSRLLFLRHCVIVQFSIVNSKVIPNGVFWRLILVLVVVYLHLSINSCSSSWTLLGWPA